MAICYRCGESGHLIVACRNSLVYFFCRQTGHRSTSCRFNQPPPQAVLPPPPQPTPVPPLAPLPVLSSQLTVSSAQPSQPSIPPVLPASTAMVPPPSQARLLEANTLPVLRYYATLATSRFCNIISQGVVLTDVRLFPFILLALLNISRLILLSFFQSRTRLGRLGSSRIINF